MKFPSQALLPLSPVFCFYMISVLHGKVETTKELLVGAAGNSAHVRGAAGAECGKENYVDCKQGKGGAAQETVLDEDYFYTTSLVP